MDWIESEGGPLICLEKRLLSTWGGVDRLTVPQSAATNDYDRACAIESYTAIIPLSRGEGLVLGDVPFSTTIYFATAKRIMIARAIFASGREDQILAGHCDLQLSDWTNIQEVNWRSSPIIMFDSACPGDYCDLRGLSFEIEPGVYRVSTRRWDPDSENAFILHAFERL